MQTALLKENIEGTVNRVIYYNEENGFTILSIKSSKGHLLTAKGFSPEKPTQNKNVVLTGKWIKDKKYGEQFEFEVLQINLNSPDGIYKFLTEVDGMTPTIAKELIKIYGDNVFEALKSQIDLTIFPRCSEARQDRIYKDYQIKISDINASVFLFENGITPGIATKIIKHCKDKEINIEEYITNNPYQLYEDIDGIGFKTADEIALKFNFSTTSPERIQASVIYCLKETANDGHCCFEIDKLINNTVNLLYVNEDLVKEAVEYLIRTNKIIQSDDLVYSKELYLAETQVAKSISTLLKCPKVDYKQIDINKTLEEFQTSENIVFSQSQARAYEQILNSKVSIITGGGGVGKTTLIKSIINYYEESRELTIILAAPTGRASKRMQESTGKGAATIHRLLGFNGEGFIYNEEHKLEGDVFIIDECSMIDIRLAKALLAAIPNKAIVIFVGDVNQLPSIGPGLFLNDLINSGVITTCYLTEVLRQAKESHIISRAHDVNNGIVPEFDNNSDCIFLEINDPDDIEKKILELSQDFIEDFEGFQVLSFMKKNNLGIDNLNPKIQQLLNKHEQQLEIGKSIFRYADKVMQIKNDHETGVYNGDIGRINNINNEDNELKVNFGSDDDVLYEKIYPKSELNQLTLSYACTVHKSQGSEYPVVIMPLHTQQYIMLQRNILYTAITRAKEKMIIIGTRKALEIAVKNIDNKKRFTLLKERLINERVDKTTPRITQ